MPNSGALTIWTSNQLLEVETSHSGFGDSCWKLKTWVHENSPHIQHTHNTRRSNRCVQHTCTHTHTQNMIQCSTAEAKDTELPYCASRQKTAWCHFGWIPSATLSLFTTDPDFRWARFPPASYRVVALEQTAHDFEPRERKLDIRSKTNLRASRRLSREKTRIWDTNGNGYKFHLYMHCTPAGLSTFSWGWGLPTLGCLCKALPDIRKGTETDRCLAKRDFETYRALWTEGRATMAQSRAATEWSAPRHASYGELTLNWQTIISMCLCLIQRTWIVKTCLARGVSINVVLEIIVGEIVVNSSCKCSQSTKLDSAATTLRFETIRIWIFMRNLLGWLETKPDQNTLNYIKLAKIVKLHKLHKPHYTW